MLSKEQYEKLKYQIAMHKPVSSVVAMSVDSVESLFEMIDKLEENTTAQALALKAAKAMQKAETERADANERDAERYRWLRSVESRGNQDVLVKIASKSGNGWSYTTSIGDALDKDIDQAMRSL